MTLTQTVNAAPGMPEEPTGVTPDPLSTDARRRVSALARTSRLLVACELVAALRAVRISQPPLTETQLRAVELCQGMSAVLEDRDLTADIESAGALLPALAELVELD